MVRTIYRGYDITAQQKQGDADTWTWKVYDPKNQGVLLHETNSEDAAMSFVDKHKRSAAA